MIAGWLVVESIELHAGLGVQLMDDHTGLPVETAAAIALDVRHGTGWREIDRSPVVLPGAVFFYRDLERHRDAAGRPAVRYRVRARADRYHPLYLATGGGGIEVVVFPWDTDSPPADSLRRPEPLAMLPRPSHPFAPALPVLRGSTVTAAGAPVAGALLSYDQPRPSPEPPRPIRVLSEEDGEFALPVRGITAVALNVTVSPPTGPSASFPFIWRDDVKKNNRLTL